MTPEQEEDLRLFRDRVADLRRRSLLQGSGTLVLQVSPEVPTGLTGISEDELRAVLALLRQFTLKGPTKLKRIYRLVKTDCPVPELRQWADYAWRGWEETMESIPLGAQLLQGHRYTVKEAMDLLLNTQIVHADRLKSRILRPEDTISQGFLRQIVVVSLDRLCHGPILIDLVIGLWLSGSTESVPAVPAVREP